MLTLHVVDVLDLFFYMPRFIVFYGIENRAPVAQLVWHQAAVLVVSSTPAGPKLRVLNNWGGSAVFVHLQMVRLPGLVE